MAYQSRPNLEIKAALQGSVGYALLTRKQIDDLGDQFIIIHGGLSAR